MSTHKLLHLFEKSQKISFKEQRFIFDGPEDGRRRPPEVEAPTAPPSPEKRNAVEKNSRLNIAILEDTVSEPLLQEDYQLKKDLENLDQDKFDKIVEERLGEIKAGYPKTELDSQQLGKLIEFAKKDEDNMETLFDEFKDKHIPVERLNPESVAAFINYAKDDKEDLEIVINPFINKLLASVIVTASESDPTILKTVYEKMKSDSSILKSLNSKALKVLGDNLDDTDFQDFVSRLDDNAKSILLTTEIKPARGTIILDDFLKRGLNTLASNVLENIISYVCQKKGDMIYTRPFLDQLNGASPASQETAKKLTPAAAKVLIEKIYERYEGNDSTAASYFRNITKNLSLESRKALIDNKTLKIDIRKALHKSSSDSEKKGIPVPMEEAKAVEPAKPSEPAKGETPKTGDATATDKPEKAGEPAKPGETKSVAKFETFKENITDKEMLAKAGIELIEKGRGKVQWTFTAKDIDGNKDSQRFFVATPAFRGQLTAKIDGKLVNNTAEKVKLVSYQWLLDKVYDKGNVKAAIGNVEEFEKSQAFLRKQIDELTKIVEEQNKAAGTVAPRESAVTDKAPQKPGDTAVAPTEGKAAPGVDKAEAKERTECEKNKTPYKTRAEALRDGDIKEVSKKEKPYGDPYLPARDGETFVNWDTNTTNYATKKTIYTNPDRAYITKLHEDGKWHPSKDVTDGKDPNIGKYSDIQYMAEKGELYAKHSVAGKEVISKWNKEAKKWEPKQPETKTADQPAATPDEAGEKPLKFATIEGTKKSGMTIKLPDGSALTLTNGAEISVNKTEGQFQRIITSKGDILIVDGKTKEAFMYNTDEKPPKWENTKKGGEYKPNTEQAKAIKTATKEQAAIYEIPDRPRTPEEIRTYTNPTLIDGKVYQIKPSTLYYTNSPTGTPITNTDKITLVTNSVREVEGKKYVEIGINTGKDGEKMTEGWIPLEQLIIPEEDEITVKPGESSSGETMPDSFKKEGTFAITSEMHGSELLDALFAQAPSIKTKLAESGMSNVDYLKLITKYRQGDKLPIIVPDKQMSAIMAEYERRATNTEYQQKDSEAKTRLYENRADYLEKPRYLTDKGLIEAINDNGKWNDLLEKRGEYKNNYIDGYEKVASIMKQFGVEKENLRGALKDLLQIGYNEKVTFDEIFGIYFEDKSYKGDFDDFKTDLENLAKSDQPGNKAKLQGLKNNILFPISELLDALESMSIKVSTEQSFADKYDAVLSRVPETTEPLAEKDTYYNMESLVKGGDVGTGLAPYKEAKTLDLAAISGKAQEKFGQLLTDLKLDKTKFSPQETIRLVFQLYSPETLAKEGCLQKSPGSDNKFVLTDLPKNFSKDNPQVVALFTEVGSGDKITAKAELIRKISETLDKNKAIVKRLMEVFSKDEGPTSYDLVPIDLLGISYLVRALDGEDRRELAMTMSDISEGKDSLMPDDFLNKYLSDRAAFSEILSKISSVKDGANVYDETSLKTEFKQRAIHGLNFAIINSKNNPQIYQDLTQRYGDLKNPEKFLAAKADLAKRVNDNSTPLDKLTRELIRIGHVIDGQLEDTQQKEQLGLSTNPDIRKVQDELIRKGKLTNFNDVQIVGNAIAGAIIAARNGVTIAGAAIDLPGNWKLGVGIGINESGVSPSVGVSKSLELTKDGRTVLSFAVTGGAVHIGGAVNFEFPISKDINMNVGAAAGLTPAGFYALSAVGISKDLNAATIEAIKAEKENQGYDAIDKMIAEGKSAKEIADALVKLPGNGAGFQRLRDEKVPDSGLIEYYKFSRQSLEHKTTAENSEASFVPKALMLAAGTANGAPIVMAALTWVVGDKTMIVRRVIPGASEYSELHVQQALQEKFGKNIQIMKTKAGASGDIVFDANSGKVAVLEGSEKLDLRKFDSYTKFDEELQKAHMGITKEKDGSIRLHINNPGEVPANIKVLVDPKLQELGVNFTVEGNKIIFKGLSEREISQFIITRENFHYPFNNDGANKLSVITIKANPKRTRAKIEQESPNIIYQAAGYKPEIRRGIGEGKSTPVILDAKAYGEVKLDPKETLEKRNMEDFESWQKENKEALNIITEKEFGKVENPETLFKFADKFYAKNKRIFRELTTKKADGNDKYNPEELTKLIQDAAQADKTIGKPLNSAELNQMIIHMIGKTFMNAQDKRNVFERNLEFCKNRILKPFLEGEKTKLKLTSSVDQMLQKIDSDMKNVNLNSKKYEDFAKGTLFLSAVGTMGIKGLRGTPYYGTELDKEYGILNFNKYNPGEPGVEGDLGKALLSITSPLDTSDDRKFMESPLAMKLAAMDAMYLVLGQDARKVSACFKTENVEAENKEAFEKFKAIVVQLREAEYQGKNYIELDNGYEIHIKAKIGVGNYKKCTNPTMAVTEDFEIYGPVNTGTAVEHDQKILLDTKAVRKAVKLLVGVMIDRPSKPPTQPPPEQREGVPDTGHGGKVGQHPGGAPSGTTGQGPQTSQHVGGDATGNSQSNIGAVGSDGKSL